MNYMEMIEISPDELSRRRKLALERRRRESDREALLGGFIQATTRAGNLQNWINAYENANRGDLYPELRRMLDWARSELEELNAALDADRIGASLRDRNLFPEIDDLEDPLGEPPARVGWGR